jgi:hypothetical protein
MKWDIDKALRQLEDPRASGTAIDRILVDATNPQLLADLRLTTPKTSETAAVAWAVGIGKSAQRKLFFYGWTIREAYLKARREVKKMTLSAREGYGIPTPKKRSNSYASARKKHRS